VLTKWITSMDVFSPLVLPVLEMAQPKQIAEIGAAEGGNTKVLYDFSKQHGNRLITIDPFPRGSFLEWVKQSQEVVTHIAEFSLVAISKVDHADVWFIDGDHNWFTVYNELRLIDALAQKNQQPALIFLHDVGWPCARRDMYYDPHRLPAEFVHPNSSELGVIPGRSESIKGGLRGPHWAIKEGGPRNGVLTAIEDFRQSSKIAYHWINIPAILGLGVLVDPHHPMADNIVQYFAPYHNHPLIALLERDRVAQYLGVVALNDKLNKMALAMNGTVL
jgi:hypothetical protein